MDLSHLNDYLQFEDIDILSQLSNEENMTVTKQSWYDRLVPMVKEIVNFVEDGATEEGVQLEEVLEQTRFRCRQMFASKPKFSQQSQSETGMNKRRRLVDSQLSTSVRKKTHGTKHM